MCLCVCWGRLAENARWRTSKWGRGSFAKQWPINATIITGAHQHLVPLGQTKSKKCLGRTYSTALQVKQSYIYIYVYALQSLSVLDRQKPSLFLLFVAVREPIQKKTAAVAFAKVKVQQTLAMKDSEVSSKQWGSASLAPFTEFLTQLNTTWMENGPWDVLVVCTKDTTIGHFSNGCCVLCSENPFDRDEHDSVLWIR